MSCAPDTVTFRLLDAYVGWDGENAKNLVGFDDPAGVRLNGLARQTDPSAIAQALPPARLARACSPCAWFLVTCCPPQSRLLRLDACTKDWTPVHTGRCAADGLVCATAIALHRDRIAISDPGAGHVSVWRKRGKDLAFTIPMKQPGPLAWAPWKAWLVVDLAASMLRQFDPSGAERFPSLALPGPADGIGVDTACRIWLVTRENEEYAIWSAERGKAFVAATLQDLLAAFPDTKLRHARGGYFCIEDEVEGNVRRRCFDCHGRPSEPPVLPPQAQFETQGQMLTLAIDSGMPRCRWHRVRVDADIPPGTAVAIAVSSHEEPKPAPQPTIVDAAWNGFETGLPHQADWQEGAQGARDFLIDQPPGRYLFLRLRLTGDGSATPVVRRIRLDFPRRTSFDKLPAVYRDNPAAEDFGERFLSLFDAAIEDMDRVIERYPALLDVDGAPGELLPWIGGFLGLAMDPAWSVDQRRKILKATPELYRRRGTREGLRMALELVTGLDPAIEEIAGSRPWDAVGSARLKAVRLFGQSAARLRLDRSRLSSTPVWSIGNPDLDAVNSNAYRFRVQLPVLADAGVREQAERVVEALKPAHTVASLHQGRLGMVVGMGSGVGIDTAIAALPPPVLGGEGGVRLSRASVLWAANDASQSSINVGRSSAVGVHTIME